MGAVRCDREAGRSKKKRLYGSQLCPKLVDGSFVPTTRRTMPSDFAVAAISLKWNRDSALSIIAQSLMEQFQFLGVSFSVSAGVGYWYSNASGAAVIAYSRIIIFASEAASSRLRMTTSHRNDRAFAIAFLFDAGR